MTLPMELRMGALCQVALKAVICPKAPPRKKAPLAEAFLLPPFQRSLVAAGAAGRRLMTPGRKANGVVVPAVRSRGPEPTAAPVPVPAA